MDEQTNEQWTAKYPCSTRLIPIGATAKKSKCFCHHFSDSNKIRNIWPKNSIHSNLCTCLMDLHNVWFLVSVRLDGVYASASVAGFFLASLLLVLLAAGIVIPTAYTLAVTIALACSCPCSCSMSPLSVCL